MSLPTAPRYTRRTSRFDDGLRAVGFSLGGNSGARLASVLNMQASASTLLRLLHRADLPEHPTPRVLAVDDFAFRKGHRYGSILLDLENHHPVDLLPDRKAESLANWLREHAGVEIISRDRGGAYAEGGMAGAPNARQVADRWHVLKNMGDALERFFISHNVAIRAAEKTAPFSTNPGVDAADQQSTAEGAAQQCEPHSGQGCGCSTAHQHKPGNAHDMRADASPYTTRAQTKAQQESSARRQRRKSGMRKCANCTLRGCRCAPSGARPAYRA